MEENVTEEMIDLLKKVADLCCKANEEVYDDSKENGTANILNLCDKLQEAIDEYVLDYECKKKLENDELEY